MQAAGFKLGRAVSTRTGVSSGPLRCFPGGLAVCLSSCSRSCSRPILYYYYYYYPATAATTTSTALIGLPRDRRRRLRRCHLSRTRAAHRRARRRRGWGRRRYHRVL